MNRPSSLAKLSILVLLAFTLVIAAGAFRLRGASVPDGGWKITGPYGGTATYVAVDPKNPKTILAGGRESFLYQSRDGGSSWQISALPHRAFGEVTSILVDPANSDHYLVGILATDRPGILQTTDAGKTWTVNESPDVKDVGVRALTVSQSSPSVFAAGTSKGVVLSRDSGATWTRISDPGNLEMQAITAVTIDPKNPDIIYAGTTHLPWKTKDGGKTWTPIHEGMIDDSDVFSIYVDPASPSSVFASACSGIYASTNQGEMWQKLLGIPNTSRRTHVVREDPAEPGVLYAGTTMGLFKSGSGGSNWRNVLPEQVNSLAFDPTAPKVLYLALESQGIARSEDGGASVKLINNGFVDRNVSAMTTAGTKLFAVQGQTGEGSALFVSENQGEGWQPLQNVRGLAGVHLRSITGFNSQARMLVGSTSQQIYKSSTGGESWVAVPIRLQTEVRPPSKSKSSSATARASAKPIMRLRIVHASEISGVYTAKNGAKDILFAATNLGLLRSADFGEHWQLSDMGMETSVSGLFIGAANDGRLVARTPSALYYSKDFGDHWTALSFPLKTSSIHDVAIGKAMLVGTDGGLFTSTDDGQNWTRDVQGLTSFTVTSVVVNPANISFAYLTASGAVYQSTDGGTSWSPHAADSLAPQIRQLWMPSQGSHRLYAITNDLGILVRGESSAN